MSATINPNICSELKFDDNGLIPAIVQDSDTHQGLLLATTSAASDTEVHQEPPKHGDISFLKLETTAIAEEQQRAPQVLR